MSLTLNQMAEAARALNGPLFADLPDGSDPEP